MPHVKVRIYVSGAGLSRGGCRLAEPSPADEKGPGVALPREQLLVQVAVGVGRAAERGCRRRAPGRHGWHWARWAAPRPRHPCGTGAGTATAVSAAGARATGRLENTAST